MDKAKSYIEIPKLTPKSLWVLISKIEVYEKLKKYSCICGNPIIIHYAFHLPEQTIIPKIEKMPLPQIAA